jgi:hypothetical protein
MDNGRLRESVSIKVLSLLFETYKMKNHFMKSIIREDAVITLEGTGAGGGGEQRHRKLKRLHYT